MIQLYPFQSALIDDVRASLRDHKSVLMQSACRSGKTQMAAFMTRGAYQRSRRVMFLCHRSFLIDQTSATFKRAGIPHSFIASGMRCNKLMPVHIASVGTLVRRLDQFAPPDLLIIDEAHRSPAASYDQIQKWARDAKKIGLSASPWRLDGTGLDQHYETMVSGPEIRWLISEGFLSDYRAFVPSKPDLTGVHSRMGDFVESELSAILDNKQVIGDVVGHYRKYADGLRSLYFGVSVAHSKHLAAAFTAAGIPAVHMDAETPTHERRENARKLALGSIRIICSVNLCTEGYDLASQAGMPVSIDCVGLVRPTQSVSLHVQMMTRSLTPAPGKTHGLILDHAGNLERLGLPDHDFQWSLEGREKGRRRAVRETGVSICRSCTAAYPSPMPKCPYCGVIKIGLGRSVDEVEGELREIDRDLFQPHSVTRVVDPVREQRKKEQRSARSIDDLIALARSRGYKSPEKWAAHVYSARLSGGKT